MPNIAYANQEFNSPSNFDDLNNAYLFETDAYVSDDDRAAMGIVSGGFWEIQYWDYDFDIDETAVIDEVWLYAEHASGHAEDVVEARLSRNGGDTWGAWVEMHVVQFEIIWDIDFSEYYEWQAADFTNENFRVALHADINATGCYFPESEVGLWESDKTINFDMTVKKITDVKKGDILLGYNKTTGEYIPNLMLSDANIIKGDFLFYHIITEFPMEKWDKEIFPWENPKEIGHKDVCITSEQRMFTLEKGLIRADEIEIGMHLHGLFRQEGRMVTEPVRITSIKTFKGKTAVTLDGTSEYFFTHYLYAKIVKTYYLDHLPVKVIYTIPPPPFTIAPFFIGMLFVFGLAAFVFWVVDEKKH